MPFSVRALPRFLFSIAILTGIPAAGPAETTAPAANVLFIAVDDLRPEIGCYGAAHMKTPFMDGLARRGTVFNRAYCQQAVCAPSRASVMTGRRPDSTGVWDLKTRIRVRLPDAVTVSQLFRNHGAHAMALGKIFHPSLDDELSWSEPTWANVTTRWGTSATMEAMGREERRNRLNKRRAERGETDLDHTSPTAPVRYSPARDTARGPAWESAEFGDEELGDGLIAGRAVEALQRLKNEEKPFFLAVGFLRPHLPFIAPKKYYDLYPPESIRLPDTMKTPLGMPDVALEDYGEIRSYGDIPTSGPIPAEKARELIRGYYASVSYVDAQIGRVLEQLDRLGLRDNTVVVLWGDHGWHLGDHGRWCKHSNFEVATRSPLIVAAPGQKAPGSKTDALVELVDIYPTLAELCALPVPAGLEGTSFAPLLNDPGRPWKSAAFSQYPRGRHTAMGYSMRTATHRYTEWLPWSREKGVASREPLAVELYDSLADPGEHENVALRPENKALTGELSRKLRAGWKESVPTER